MKKTKSTDKPVKDTNSRKKGYIAIGLLLGVLCLLAATALGLGLIHIGDWFYSLNVDLLDIPARAGVTKQVCLDNYNAVIEYLSPFSRTSFNLPDFRYSANGAQHFADCKPIFNGVYFAGLVSLVLIIILSLRFIKRKDKRFLRVSSVTTLAVPVVLVAACTIDFDSAFVLFHKVFFTNDLWLFDIEADPVLNILPAEFFMNCAIFIALLWFAAAIVQLVLYRNSLADRS